MVVDLLDTWVCVLGIKTHILITVVYLKQQIIFFKSTLNFIFFTVF